MKVSKDWIDEQDLFDLVTDALIAHEEEGDFTVHASEEQDSYGEQGYMHIRKGGRTFALNLYEIR